MDYNDKLYYRVETSTNMMLTKPNWEDDPGYGDALWRTSMAYIAYGDDNFGQAVKSCFRKFTMINHKGKYWYQGSRYAFRYNEDDVSRDQTIMALASLKLNKNPFLNELIDHLPYKLSRRFNQTPTMWFWTKALKNDSPFMTFMFHLMLTIELLLQIPLTKLLRSIAGLSKYSTIPVNKETIKYKIYDALEFPGYAAHLNAWQMYTVKKSILYKIPQLLLLWNAEKANLLIRLLLGKKVSEAEINDYVPRTEWRWSGRENGDSDYRTLNEEEASGNLLDKDILYAIKQRS